VRLTPKRQRQAEECGAVLFIEGEGWYYAEAPEIPTDVVPLDTLADRKAAQMLVHRAWCRANGREEPAVQAELRRYMNAVTDYLGNAEAG
jgi:hypothetical protein